MSLRLSDLALVTDDDENDVLYDPAARVEGLIPDYDPLDEALLEEGVVGYLKKKWNAKLHPRWPKGTPRAGEFMKKGQWFKKDGKLWQITSTSGGKIEAIEASGKPAAVEHRVFEPKASAAEGPGVAVPGVKPASRKFDRTNAPVAIPYVQPETHDPKVKLPKGSKLTAEDWKRFGKIDQDYYRELMGRFGEWKPDQVHSMMSQLWQSYDANATSAINEAFGSHYSSGGYWAQGAGKWLNLATLLKNTDNAATLKAVWAKYEDTKVVLDEINELVHWDLYNRTRAPDISLFHGGEQGVAAYKDKYLSGKEPIYAGYSQSFHLGGAQNWGNTIMMTPTAIRHVVLSQYTIIPGHGGMKGEQEMAVGVRMKLDDRSVTFNSSDMGMGSSEGTAAVKKWLQGLATGEEPIGGSAVQDLKDVWAGKGPIPIPPEKAMIQALGHGPKQYEELSPALAKQAGEMAHKLEYKVPEGETPTPEGALGVIDQMGLKPGDFIEGMQGTRYVIIADASDDVSGLRYVKVEQDGTINYAKSWEFSASAGNNFKRLAGHIEILKKLKAGYAAFTEEQYAKLAKGKAKLVSEYKPDEMLTVGGEGYKVIGMASGGKVEIESLDDGNSYTINTLYKAVPLVPKKGFVPPTATVDLEQGQLVLWAPPHGPATVVEYIGTPSGEPTGLHEVKLPSGLTGSVPLAELDWMDSPLPQKAEVGDSFAFEGKKWTITNIEKSGKIKAKPTGGKVEAFAPPTTTPTVGINVIPHNALYRPGELQLGGKQKAGTLLPGDLISGSPVKIRPYMVIGGVATSNEVVLRNMETGELTRTTKGKSWPVLTKVSLEPEEPKGAKPPKPETTLPDPVPTGEQVVFSELEVGDQFKMGKGKYEKVDATHVKLLGKSGGIAIYVGTSSLVKDTINVEKLASKADMAEPVETGSFDISQYVEGPASKLADLPEGAVFKSKTGLPFLLKSKKPKAGATAVALHNGKTVKGLGYEGAHVTLIPKVEATFDYDQMSKGDFVELSKLKKGDWFKITNEGGAAYQVMGPADVHEVNMVMAAPTGGSPLPYGPALQVEFLAHGGVVAPKPPQVQDYTELDDVGDAGFDGYKSGPMLKSMPNGTYFKDKAGNKWLLKDHGSGVAVLADPNGDLWSALLTLRGKVSDEVLFADKSPPLGAELQPLGPNASDITVEELNVGDHFMYGGKRWELLDDFGNAQDVQTGKGKKFATFAVPTSVPLGVEKEEEPLPDDEPPGFEQNLGSTPLGQLPVGTQFVDGLGDVVTITGKKLGVGNQYVEAGGSQYDADFIPTTIKEYEPGDLPWGSTTLSVNSWVANAEAGAADDLDAKLAALSDDQLAQAAAQAKKVGANFVANLIQLEQGKRKPGPFFNKLKVGDKAAFAQTGTEVTVTDNQIPGQGIEVETTTGAKSTAYAGDLVPLEPASGDLFSPVSEPISPGIMGNWEVARTASGKLIYKHGESKKLFYLGQDKEFKGKAKVTPLEVLTPDPDSLVDVGDQKIADFQPGQVIYLPNATQNWLVLANGKDGVTAKSLKDGKMAFTPHDVGKVKTAILREPGKPSPEPSVMADLSVGMTFSDAIHPGATYTVLAKGVGADGAAGNYVHVKGDNGDDKFVPDTVADTWVVKDVGRLTLGDVRPIGLLPVGAVVKHDEGGWAWEITGHGFGDKIGEYGNKVALKILAGGTVGGSDSVNADEDFELVALNADGWGEVLPPGEDPGAAFEQVKVTHVDQMQVGDTYYVPDHHLTWKVIDKPNAEAATIELISKAPGAPAAFAVGEHSHISGPIEVTVTRNTADPLTPYLHSKSGKYKYDKIGSLAPGDTFADKTKKQYKVIGHYGDQTAFEDPSGATFSTSGKSRVKVVPYGDSIFHPANQPNKPLGEARVVFSTNGSVRLAA